MAKSILQIFVFKTLDRELDSDPRWNKMQIPITGVWFWYLQQLLVEINIKVPYRFLYILPLKTWYKTVCVGCNQWACILTNYGSSKVHCYGPRLNCTGTEVLPEGNVLTHSICFTENHYKREKDTIIYVVFRSWCRTSWRWSRRSQTA